MTRRLEVWCLCGSTGRLTFTGKQKNGRDICNFVCSCVEPKVNFESPYISD